MTQTGRSSLDELVADAQHLRDELLTMAARVAALAEGLQEHSQRLHDETTRTLHDTNGERSRDQRPGP